VKMTILLFACTALGVRAQAAAKSDAVDALFSAYNQGNVPGASVIVIRDGKVLYRHAYGLPTWKGTWPPVPLLTTGIKADKELFSSAFICVHLRPIVSFLTFLGQSASRRANRVRVSAPKSICNLTIIIVV
jgi:hypothetical protein